MSKIYFPKDFEDDEDLSSPDEDDDEYLDYLFS